MPITNRNLSAGAILTARFKGVDHTVVVLEHDGKLAFELDGGTIYKSPSAAGSAVMGGTACNGWRFWSLEGEEAAPKERAPKAPNEPRAARPKPARGTPAAPTIDYRKWTDERLDAHIESIRADLPSLDGEVLDQSKTLLERAEAERARRAPAPEAAPVS